MSKLTNYLRDTRGELTHVAWPTRRQALIYSVVVVIVSVLSALFLSFFDYIFSLIIQKFVI